MFSLKKVSCQNNQASKLLCQKERTNFINFTLQLKIIQQIRMADPNKRENVNNLLRPSSSFKNLTEINKNEMSIKYILRKPSSRRIEGTLSKNNSRQRDKKSQNPNYFINSPNTIIPIVQSITNQTQFGQRLVPDLKTERKQFANQKSVDKSVKSKRFNDDSSDYYKYWKKKANQYQEMNFTLHRLNSSLQQENQILKHKFQRLQNKLIKMYEPENPIEADQQKNYSKLQNYYKAKIDQLSKKIEEQQLLISKQQKKIKELSKHISENYHLKNILDNMQEKVSELRSNGNKDSRADSMEKISQKTDFNKMNKKTITDIDAFQVGSLNKTAYSIDKNKRSDSFNFSDYKLHLGQKY